VRFVVQWAESRGRRIAFSTAGDPAAPPLVMLRGLARTSRHWGEILDELARDFWLILPDNRGIGRSDVPRLPFTTGHMADDTARVLDHAGVERAHVFGISLGGMIAQQVVLRHPTRVERLILGCTRAGGRLSARMPLRTVFGLVAPMRLPADLAIRQTAKLILSEAFLAERADVLDEWVALARELPPSRRGVIYQLLAGALHNASARLAEISTPTLVVTGDADRLIDAKNSELIARAIPNARLELLPGAGHDFPTEQPREAAELVRRFCLETR
jgi:3-oxoadipate enol-lactonase